MSVRVLVVEDEAIAAEAHATYVGRVPGFEVAGGRPVGQRGGAVAGRATAHVDLVLLDMHLPDGHGLGLLAAAPRGRPPVRRHRGDLGPRRRRRTPAVSQGVVLYLLKPFTFATFGAKLRSTPRSGAAQGQGDESIDQRGVDAVFGAMRPAPEDDGCPKG